MTRKDVRFNAKYIKNTANNRKDDKVQGKEIGNGTITANHIANGAVTSEKLANGIVFNDVVVMKGQRNPDGQDRTTYWPYGDKVALSLEPAENDGAVGILFPSQGNKPSDFAYIVYDEDYGEAGVSAGENSVLLLGSENDGTGSSDHVRVKSRLVVEADMSSSDPTNAFEVKSGNVTSNLFSVSRSGTTTVSTINATQLNASNGEFSGTCYTSNWFRSRNNTGWYNQTHGGGIWMEDSTYVKVYGGKTFRTPKILCDGDITVSGLSYLSNIRNLNTDLNIYYYFGAARMAFQGDRNVVIYNSSNTVLWSANTSVSDIRFKKDIINYQLDTISLLKKLNIIEFTYNEDIESDNMRRVGFSAQDVQKLIPQAVKSIGPDKDNQTLILNKEELVPFLTKAIQEQQEIIETQQKRIDSLEERLKVLEDLLK